MQILDGKKNIHFVGIGGVGMSALARVLLHLGYNVSGTDIKETKWTRSLREYDARITIGHSEGNLEGVDLLVYSSAIHPSNPEIKKALELGLTLCHRARLLAEVVSNGVLIAVSGTHGKTTTSSIISHIFATAGYNPTCVVGGLMANGGDNVVLGGKELFIAEVDESDRSQSHFRPDYLVLTNLEAEHLDIYRDLRDLEAAFHKYIENVKEGGKIIFSSECSNLRSLISGFNFSGISYGFSPDADYTACDIKMSGRGTSYVLCCKAHRILEVSLRIPGLHNVANSLATLALADQFGLSLDVAAQALADFKGVGRRLEVKLDSQELMVVDDYAHHPTEVEASLAALSLFNRPVTVVFQPHRYSRILHLGNAFGCAFRQARRVILTEIYSAGEKPCNGVSAELIYKAVQEDGHPDVCLIAKEDVVDFLKTHTPKGELVAFLGAGDISEVAHEYVNQCRSFAQVS